MKHAQLINHIKGSFLKEQFLEAFLVQSAYIEGLLKLYADFKIFEATQGKSHANDKLLSTIKARVEKYSLNELTDLFYKAELISKEQVKLLSEYRVHRNRTLHDLLKYIGKEDFERELKEVCEKGNQIINEPKFQQMAQILEDIEKYKHTEVNKKDPAVSTQKIPIPTTLKSSSDSTKVS